MGDFRRLTKAARLHQIEKASHLLPRDDTELWDWILQLRDLCSHHLALPVLEYVTQFTDRPFIDQVIGWFYYVDGDYAKASEAYRRAIRDERILVQEGLFTAWMLSKAGQSQAALRVLDRLDGLVPKTSAFRLTRAEALARIGRIDEGIRLVREVAHTLSDNIASARDIVESFVVCHGFEDAIGYIQTLPPLTSVEGMVELAIALIETGDERTAEALLTEIPPDRMSARAYYARSQLQIHRECYSSALEEIERSLALEPKSASAAIWKAYVLGRMRRFAEADAVLRHVLQRRPLDPAARKLLDEIIRERTLIE